MVSQSQLLGLKVSDCTHIEQVKRDVNHTIGHMFVGWVGDDQGQEGRDLLRTHTALARHKGIKVGYSSRLVKSLVDRDVSGGEQNLHIHQEGFLKQVLVEIPLGLHDRS